MYFALLHTATRAVEFFKAYPPPNPVATSLLERLATLIADFQTLGEAEGNNDAAKVVATRRRVSVERYIRLYFLRPIAGFAVAAFPDDPEQVAHFRLPPKGSRAFGAFVVAVRRILGNVRQHHELLEAQGMDPALPDQLAETLAECESLPSIQATRSLAAKGARTSLEATTSGIMDILQQLDAINRHRLRDDPKLLEAWRAIRTIPLRSARRKVPESLPATGTEGSQG